MSWATAARSFSAAARCFCQTQARGPRPGPAPAALSKQQATRVPGGGTSHAQGPRSPHPGVRPAFREDPSR